MFRTIAAVINVLYRRITNNYAEWVLEKNEHRYTYTIYTNPLSSASGFVTQLIEQGYKVIEIRGWAKAIPSSDPTAMITSETSALT